MKAVDICYLDSILFGWLSNSFAERDISKE